MFFEIKFMNNEKKFSNNKKNLVITKNYLFFCLSLDLFFVFYFILNPSGCEQSE